MVVLVFVLGGVSITLYVDRTITTQIEDRERAYLVSVDNILSHQISSAQQTLDMLITHPLIIQRIYAGDTSWNSSSYQSGQMILNAIDCNQVCNSIYIISGDTVVLKTSRRYHTTDAEAMMVNAMRTQFRQALVPWHDKVGSRTNHNLMILRALDSIAAPNTTGGVLINLDLDRLVASAFSDSGSSDIFLVMDDQIIASSRTEYFFTPVSDHALLAEAIPSGATLYDGNYIFSLHSDVYGYTLYAIQDRSQLMLPVRTGLGVLMLSLCLMLAITLLISRRAALHAYTPVKTILIQLEEQLPADTDAPAEELNELQRASRSIRHTSEIVSAYRRDADTVRISRYIHSCTPCPSMAEILYKHLGYDGTQPLYMLLFGSDSTDDARMAADVLQGALSGYACFLTLAMPGQRLLSLACVTAPTSAEDNTVAASAHQVLQILTDHNASKVIMTLEKITDGVETLPAAYSEMLERMRSGIFCARSTLLPEAHSMILPAEMTQQVLHAVQEMDPALYRRAVEAYLTALCPLPAREAYHQLATLCMHLSETGSARNQDISDRLDSYRTILNDLFVLPDHPALTSYMQELFQNASERIQLKRSGESNPLVDRILSYTAANFMDPALSASQVAEELGVSVSHLSRIMSRAIGCTFPELLQRYRLEKAADLLRSSDMPIAQLAQQCGFGSASYFTASFKRIYGMVPSGYRTQHAGESPASSSP